MPIKAALTIGAKGAGKVAKATDQEALVEAAKAADRAAAGRRAADVAKATEPMKLSEALGNLNVEGKGKLKVTQSDRTRVGGGNIGGAMFSGLQQVDPFYEGLVWGVGEKGTASKMIGQSDPFTFWSTILGAEDQLKSNPLVFNKLRKGFTDAMKEGKLTKELEKKINHNLALTFGEGAEIRDPKIWQKADTFEKRAALADIMLGKGIPPSKGGVALGGEKSGKGVIFRPTDILKQETEPLLLHPEHGGDVPTFAVGPRLFNLEGNVVYRPDLHPGFPYLLTGEDTGMVFKPGEAEKIMRDYAQRLKDQGKARIGYYEWTLGEKGKGLPTQDINEEYLTYLQKQGMAEGGLASPEGIPPVVSDLEAQYQAYKAGGPVQMRDGGDPGSISATPQNALLGALAKALKFREEAQKGLNSPTGTLLDLILPTSETVEKLSYGDPLFRMPQQSNIPITTDKPYVAETLSMVPFAPPVARGAARGAESVGTAATRAITGKPDLTAEQIYKAMGDTEAITKLGAPAIVKPKGGNWLVGQVEKQNQPIREKLFGGSDPADALAEMEKVYNPEIVPRLSEETRQTVEQSVEKLKPMVAINQWIDQKLNRYIKNEMGTPEDPLRLGADDWAQKQQKLLADKDAEIQRATDKMEEVARQRGVTPEMLTQSRQDLLKLQKERDFIANRTGLHFRPLDFTDRIVPIEQKRKAMGFPEKPTASSEIGQLWENTADRYVGHGSQAGEVIQPNYYLREGDAERIYAQNPWLFKVPPETQVNMINTGMNEQTTGFKHMIDELKNALNPESGLPENLLIRPKDLEKMTVQQAADLVDRINAYRSVQKAEANALSAQKSIEVVKEYPETEKGLRWVEMKMLPYPEKLPEGFEVVNQGQRFMSVRKIGDDGRGAVVTGADLKDVIEGIYKHYPDTPGNPRKALEEALRYEGDVMQHCVGGYCPDVESGQSRIFSLRDKTGKPTVTIEVEPDSYVFSDIVKAAGKEKADAMMDANLRLSEMAKEIGLQPKFSIKQIKGPGNRRPDEEFIPFVQDFMKSQRWSKASDLQNADLTVVSPALQKMAEERGLTIDVITEINGKPLISYNEFNRLADILGGINKFKKKSGGPINLEEELRAYKAGGAVQMRDGGTPITDEISGMLPALDPNQESFGSPTFEATKFIASQIPKALVSPFVGAYKTITSGKFGTQEGIKAGEKAMEEFMLPSGELSPEAAEKVGQFGKFMEELETKYKLPPIMPEVFGPVTGSMTGMAPQLKSVAGRGVTAVRDMAAEVPPLPVGLSIEPVGKPISEVIKPGKVKVPATDLGFYSPIEKALENSPRKAGPGQAFINDIMKFSPSSGELEGTGIIDWLKTQKNVTKQDVLDYLSGNKIEIQETVRGTILTPDERQRLGDINRLLSKGEYVSLEEEKWFEATKARLQEFKEPKYESENLILPGGKNYREIVLSLPIKDQLKAFPKQAELDALQQRMSQLKAEGNREEFGKLIGERTELLSERRKFLQDEEIRLDQLRRNQYKSSHFPEPNPLAHMRMQDMNIGGKKTLVIEEIQSDWHQQGRKEGYKLKEAPDYVAVTDEGQRVGFDTQEAAQKWLDDYGGGGTIELGTRQSGVPDAPYKKDWYQLAIKRLMKYAADNDYDQIALVGPEEQIRRGSLGTYVDGLTFEKNKDGSIKLIAEKGESVVLDKTVKPEDLELYVGKNVAKKILSTEDVDGTLTGDDLMIGGEGMRQYYGRSYPDSINRIGKKYNANIEKRDHILKEFDSKDVETIPTGEADRFGREMMAYGVRDPETDEYIAFEYDFEKALKEANKKAPRTSMWFMDLPANLKADVKIGQPYKKGGAVKMQRGGPIIAPFNTVPDVTDAGNLINFSLQQELKRYA